MGFQFVVMFIDSFMDDVNYVSDVEVCVERLIQEVQDFLTLEMRPDKLFQNVAKE
jgi:hypothetical protein